jgi:uncharacterized membrane protein YbaN (DUF454 family)
MTDISETINDGLADSRKCCDECNDIPSIDEDKVISHSKIVRGLLITIGTICVIIGVGGAFVPVLPTTPFLLLAAACYMRSSRRMFNWLIKNPLFGKHLRRYWAGCGITKKMKAIAIIFLWFSLTGSTLILVPSNMWWIKLLLAVIGIGVTIHILSIKTYVKSLK